MQLEVTMREDYVGAVESDLLARRGKIESLKRSGDGLAVIVQVPLVNLFGYRAQLRSLTQGHGSFVMRFSHFAPVEPPKPPRFPRAAALRG